MLSSLLLATTLISAPADFSCCWQDTPQEVVSDQNYSPPKDKKHAADLEGDTKVGKKYSEQIEKEKDFKLSTKEEHVARVQRIGVELAKIANTNQVAVSWGDARLNPFQYTFKVIQGDDINAFSIPGGFIYVYEGLLDFVESDDELAGVLAHEIAHASFRHISTLQREHGKLQIVTIPLILAAILAGGEAGVNIAQGTQLFQMVKQSGWSVQAEQSSDYGGFQYMLKSRYNPVAMLTFMERLALKHRFQERIDLGIFQTHPVSRERAEALTNRLRDAGIPIKRSLASKAFRIDLKEKDETIEAWFGTRKITTFGGPDAGRRAQEAAVKLNEFFDSVPDLYDVQTGDDHSILGRRKPLFKVTAADASAAKMTTAELTRAASEGIKRSLYLLAYRVWDSR
ncbi:MAG TPA: M48 family metalloprotease [Fimbriimonadaceae bacterium]|nr:M48 family metalloprotease [Fimbriimonadaceae bacterium]